MNWFHCGSSCLGCVTQVILLWYGVTQNCNIVYTLVKKDLRSSSHANIHLETFFNWRNCLFVIQVENRCYVMDFIIEWFIILTVHHCVTHCGSNYNQESESATATSFISFRSNSSIKCYDPNDSHVFVNMNSLIKTLELFTL